jgi:alcohol dehydrogenase class IV
MSPVLPFRFSTSRQIIFGAGCTSELSDLLAGTGSRAIVCTGSRPERHSSLLNSLTIAATVVPIVGEPTLDVVRAATRTALAHGADVVLGIGGGSVLDVGKAVAMLLRNGGDPLDYVEVVGEGRVISKESAPFVGVPTTAGTGAEVTANAVLTSPDHRLKVSLRSAHMLPRLALVDPLLMVGCPPAVTAFSGLDALTQCLEPFVSRDATPLTDGFAREGIHRAASSLRQAYHDGGNVRARTDMALCSLLGGLALANAKLGAVHGLASPIGGLVSAPHGAVCAALLASVVKTNLHALRARQPAARALMRYEEVARLLTNRADARAEDCVAWVRETTDMLNVPGLREFGLRPDDVNAVAADARNTSSMKGNPIELTAAELREILMASM